MATGTPPMASMPSVTRAIVPRVPGPLSLPAEPAAALAPGARGAGVAARAVADAVGQGGGPVEQRSVGRHRRAGQRVERRGPASAGCGSATPSATAGSPGHRRHRAGASTMIRVVRKIGRQSAPRQVPDTTWRPGLMDVGDRDRRDGDAARVDSGGAHEREADADQGVGVRPARLERDGHDLPGDRGGVVDRDGVGRGRVRLGAGDTGGHGRHRQRGGTCAHSRKDTLDHLAPLPGAVPGSALGVPRGARRRSTTREVVDARSTPRRNQPRGADTATRRLRSSVPLQVATLPSTSASRLTAEAPATSTRTDASSGLANGCTGRSRT